MLVRYKMVFIFLSRMEKVCDAGKPPAVLMLESSRIGFIGAGNMAQAIGQGLISKGDEDQCDMA